LGAIINGQEAQPADAPNDAQFLEKIKNWLDAQGVTLELSVASKFEVALTKTPLTAVFHGRIYRDRDPATSVDKFREIDVVVRSTPLMTPIIDLTLWLIMECKSSDKYPWVFYRSSDLSHYATKFEDAFIVKRNQDFKSDALLGLRNVPIFNIAGVPYSTGGISVFSKDKSDSESESRNFVREAILQVQSAANGVSQDSINRSEHISASIFVPIVITKSPMFKVNLSEAGEVQIEGIQRELVLTRSRLNDGAINNVWVIHESEVDTVVSEFTSALSNISFNP
jgi:hypothetical protein